MSIFKAYDVRGLVDSEITADFCFATGVAFARFLQQEREPGTVVIGEDMRPSSPIFADAFSAGVTSQGMDVIRIGLASTDMLYFAAGKLNMPGAMFTASHNPAEYNGIKMCLSGARPIGRESGLLIIEKYVEEGSPIELRSVGVERSQPMLDEYVQHLLKLVVLGSMRPLKVVIDAGNGMAGYTAPAVFKGLNAEVIEMYFELDGTFPNHEANPIDPKNLQDLSKAVKKHKADIGLAFDGDADRCLLVASNGEVIDGDYILNILARSYFDDGKLKKNTVVGTVMSNLGFIKSMESAGINVEKTAVGDRYVLEKMLENDYVLGGEQSGHIIMRQFSNSGDGLLTALQIMQVMAKTKQSLLDLSSNMSKYPQVLINVKDVAKEKLASSAKIKQAVIDAEKDLAGVGRVLLRASGTESLVRVMVEANDLQLANKVADSLAQLVRLELK